MRNFYGYYDNGKYRVGCNGGTVYIYDQNDKELAKFKDIRYAYKGKFLPNSNKIIIKSTEGLLAVYDLDKLELIKKVVITRIGGQDEGFDFTNDGKYFYNIEQPFTTIRTQLNKYSTKDFNIVETLFSNRKELFLENIEFNNETNDCYVLGYIRNKDGVYDYGFIGQFYDNEIVNIRKLENSIYDYVRGYKCWEESGFTEKSLGVHLRKVKKIINISLKELFLNENLEKLIKNSL